MSVEAATNDTLAPTTPKEKKKREPRSSGGSVGVEMSGDDDDIPMQRSPPRDSRALHSERIAKHDSISAKFGEGSSCESSKLLNLPAIQFEILPAKSEGTYDEHFPATGRSLRVIAVNDTFGFSMRDRKSVV